MTLPDPPVPPPEPAPPMPPSTGAASAGDDLAAARDVLANELLAEDGTRLARAARLVSFVIVAIAACITATGLVALVVGLWAWHRPLPAALLVMLLVAPAIMAPLMVSRHALLLGRAAGHPRALLAQAQDLVSGMRTSPELRSLASSVVRPGRGRTPGSGGRSKRGLRGALRTTRLLTAVVGLAGPDKGRHPLLMGFTPVRMRTTWLAFWWSLWGWLVAITVLLGSAARLAVS